MRRSRLGQHHLAVRQLACVREPPSLAHSIDKWRPDSPDVNSASSRQSSNRGSTRYDLPAARVSTSLPRRNSRSTGGLFSSSETDWTAAGHALLGSSSAAKQIRGTGETSETAPD